MSRSSWKYDPDKPKFKYKRRSARPRAAKKVKAEEPIGDGGWVPVNLRVEHHAMVRELAEFYEASYSRVVAALVVEHYCEILAQNDEATARKIKGAYQSDKLKKQLVELTR